MLIVNDIMNRVADRRSQKLVGTSVRKGDVHQIIDFRNPQRGRSQIAEVNEIDFAMRAEFSGFLNMKVDFRRFLNGVFEYLTDHNNGSVEEFVRAQEKMVVLMVDMATRVSGHVRQSSLPKKELVEIFSEMNELRGLGIGKASSLDAGTKCLVHFLGAMIYHSAQKRFYDLAVTLARSVKKVTGSSCMAEWALDNGIEYYKIRNMRAEAEGLRIARKFGSFMSEFRP